jgi:hypothetical protein
VARFLPTDRRVHHVTGQFPDWRMIRRIR